MGYNLTVDSALITKILNEIINEKGNEYLLNSRTTVIGLAVQKGKETGFLKSFMTCINSSGLNEYAGVIKTFKTTLFLNKIINRDKNCKKFSSLVDGYVFIYCKAAEVIWPLVRLILTQTPFLYGVIGEVPYERIKKYITNKHDVIEGRIDRLMYEQLKKKYRELVAIVKNKKLYFHLPVKYLEKILYMLDSLIEKGEESIPRLLLQTG